MGRRLVPQRQGRAYVFSPGETEFTPAAPLDQPAVAARVYPVEWMVRTPADFYTVRAVVDNQELDSRNSTGAIYWEGLADLSTARASAWAAATWR